ncbi:MAG TPA: glutamine-hydrolyzing carbamoyl-phosphate synthase small subunit [Bacteroidales bacterium]|nr:glutamine-hydrolyzing carbamoyl-phosphate synthase small subunit [Bacteroidales bacterium]
MAISADRMTTIPKTEASLILENGMVFRGHSFGAWRSAAGEVVFSTAMTGYPESLTDPSYKGQILVSTYPLIGNYGVPRTYLETGLSASFESEGLQITGLVISDYSSRYSHWNAESSLSEWMTGQQIPGICGVDTRSITRLIREKGAMLGKIVCGEDIDFYDPNTENLVQQVSSSYVNIYGSGTYKIILVDCGTKNNIIRCLLKRDATVMRVPWDFPFHKEPCDGVLLSNGPGDPANCTVTIRNTRELLKKNIPVFGICLGSQIMALASGATTFKLKYGHRSHNQPVRMNRSNRCYITSQNHGYAIAMDSLPEDWEVIFTNLNDHTCEGIAHRGQPFLAVQFHPEASAGPVDTEFLFDDFMATVIKFNNERRCS